jgi:hypothetical protein
VVQILAGRSEKRQLGSRKGNTFSIAHFAAAGAEPEPAEAAGEAAGEAEGAPLDAKAFWADVLPEAVQAHEAALAAAKEPEVRCRGSSSSTSSSSSQSMLGRAWGAQLLRH